jgi:uncharacterized GH25 family protein
MTRRLLPVLVLLLLPGALPAHDYWLQPADFFPAAGASVPVHLYVGDRFVREAERPFQARPTRTFRLLSARLPRNLAARAREGDKPVIKVKLPAAGTYLLAMERRPMLIELEARKFNAYLAQEGLTAVLRQRKKSGQDRLPGRERYGRYLKALIQAGGRGDATWKRVLGQRLEIVPLADPFALKPGGALPVRVLFGGKPLAGVRVFAFGQVKDKTVVLSGTTSKEGIATFTLPTAGVWLIRLVHMRRAVKDRGADWESFWAALTFALKGA